MYVMPMLDLIAVIAGLCIIALVDVPRMHIMQLEMLRVSMSMAVSYSVREWSAQ